MIQRCFTLSQVHSLIDLGLGGCCVLQHHEAGWVTTWAIHSGTGKNLRVSSDQPLPIPGCRGRATHTGTQGKQWSDNRGKITGLPVAHETLMVVSASWRPGAGQSLRPPPFPRDGHTVLRLLTDHFPSTFLPAAWKHRRKISPALPNSSPCFWCILTAPSL